MTVTCIHSKECPKVGSDACNSICPYYIVTHGNGNGGYWGYRNVPKKYDNLFTNDLPAGAVFDTVKRYISKLPSVVEDGTGLFLYSTPTAENPFGTGVGKTLSATTILNEFTRIQTKRITKKEVSNKYNPSLFIKFSDFQNRYNAQFRGTSEMKEQASIDYYSYKELMKHTTLLVIDDIATRSSTEAFTNELYEVIDYRATEELATIYTSNIPLNKLADYLDERLASRIDGMTVQISFKGKDHRKKSF